MPELAGLSAIIADLNAIIAIFIIYFSVRIYQDVRRARLAKAFLWLFVAGIVFAIHGVAYLLFDIVYPSPYFEQINLVTHALASIMFLAGLIVLERYRAVIK